MISGNTLTFESHETKLVGFSETSDPMLVECSGLNGEQWVLKFKNNLELK